MSAAFFFSRFLQRPWQIASVVPSSPMMVRRVAGKLDFSLPVIVAEYGPGEGCHTREWLRRAHPDSRFLLFEVDPVFCRELSRQFAGDRRVEVINADCATLPQELDRRGLSCCDYVVSGIPFSILDPEPKRAILRNTYNSLSPGGAFVIYQVTNELREHALGDGLFGRAESEYFLFNVPPMFITVFRKLRRLDAPKPGGADPAPRPAAAATGGPGPRPAPPHHDSRG